MAKEGRAREVGSRAHPRVERRRHHDRTDVSLAAAVIECLAAPILLVSSDGEILARNGTARWMLRSADALLNDPERPAEPSEIEARLRTTLKIECRRQSPAVVKSDLGFALRGTPLLVCPLTPGTSAVFLLDARGPSFDAQHVARAFGFTNAEGRVAAELLCGKDLKDIATTLSISVHTVRAHVRNLLLKTATRSQRELVLRLALQSGCSSFFRATPGEE